MKTLMLILLIGWSNIVAQSGSCNDVISFNIPPPFNLVAVGYQDSVVLTWEHINVGGNTNTFVMRGSENACCGNAVAHPCYEATNQTGSTRFVDLNVNGGSIYSYKLRVVNILQEVSTWSVADSAVVLLPPLIPDSIYVHGIVFDYDHAMSDDVLEWFNYVVADSEMNFIDIVSISRFDTNTVIIFVPTLEYKMAYTISVSGVKDIYGTLINPNRNKATVYFDGYDINEPKPILIINR